VRRFIIAAAVLPVVVVTGVAYAATNFNSYTAGLSSTPSKAGTAKKPVGIGLNQSYAATSLVAGKAAGPLTDIKLTVYGVKANPAGFKTCSFALINAAHNDTGCPKGSMIGQGNTTAILGTKAPDRKALFPCNPRLDVFNAGGGKLVEFFVNTSTPGSAHYCNSIPTGATPPFVATMKQVGKNIVIDTPLPPYVSTNVTGAFYGSLVKQVVTFKASTKVKGKTVSFLTSVGCKSGKRPWNYQFTATDGTTTTVANVAGSAKCSK
jgi:hypothetical protein